MNLSDKQLLAIPLIAAGKKAKLVASEIEVTPQTLSEWNKNPEFVACLNQVRMEMLDSAVSQLRCCADKVLSELIRLATSAENEEVRRKACVELLEMLGIKHPQSGVYGWGVGATHPAEAKKEIARKENPGLHAILGDSYP